MNTKSNTGKGPGRPRVRPVNPVNIRCELSPEEHARAIEAAKAAGVSLGAFAREAVVEKSDKALRSKEGPK